MLIVLNNKCNFTLEEFKNYKEQLKNLNTKEQLILCPSSCYFPLCSDIGIDTGSQNVSKKTENITGEITAKQLRKLNISCCIVGHSERRIEESETDADINKKIVNLLNENISPILCVGETKEENENGLTKKIILNQIQNAIENISYENYQKILIAYEPIWAVNSNETLDVYEIENVINFIKNIVPNNQVLYGGGVTKDNFSNISQIEDLDGFLLGRLGNDIETLKGLI